MNQPHPPTAEEVNRKLVAQYTEIATLAGGLAHEIKNPLSTICLNMELLAEDFAEAETPARPPGAGQDRGRAARMPAAAKPARQLPQLCQGAHGAASRPRT